MMVIDALVASVSMPAVARQEPKSAGMGGMDGGGNTVFSGQVRGVDALLARVTMVFDTLFAVITLAIAKLTM